MPTQHPSSLDTTMAWLHAPVAYRMAIRKVENFTILDLRGALTQERSAASFEKGVTELVEAGARQLAINLTKVSYIDSTGIGALLVAHNTISHAGGTCIFFGVNDHTRRLLHRVHLDVVFKILDDEAAAISSC